MSAAGEPGGGRSGVVSKLCLPVAVVIVLALPFALKPRERQSKESSDLPVRRLVIVSPHSESIRHEFERAFSDFTARNYGHRTDIGWKDQGGTSSSMRWVRSLFESSPEGIRMDMFFGGGVDPYYQFSKEGLLEACDVPEDVLAKIPQQLAGIETYDAEGYWFGACLSGFGILYNKKVLEALGLPEPREWEDLGRPEYLTWVGSGDPRSSGAVHMVYEIMLQAYGWERGWANVVRMCANVRRFSRGGGQVTKDATLGEIACGMAIDFYAWRQIAEVGEDRMGFVLPEGLTVVNPDGIGILKGAPHKDLAGKFIAFVLSEEGQKLWVLRLGAPGGPKEFELDRMPIIPGFASRFGEDAAVSFDPYRWKGGFRYDSQRGSLRWGMLNDLLGAAILDTHPELVAAWRSVKDLPPDNLRHIALVTPPVSEQELLRMAEERGGDEQFRADTRARWAREAMRRYERVARGD